MGIYNNNKKQEPERTIPNPTEPTSTSAKELRSPFIFYDDQGRIITQEEAVERQKQKEEQSRNASCASSPQDERTGESYSLKDVIDAASQAIENWESSNKSASQQTYLQAQTQSRELQTSPRVSSHPVARPVPEAIQGETVLPAKSNKNQKITPYQAMMELLQDDNPSKLNVFVVRDLMYVYYDNYYQVFSSTMVSRIIYAYSRQTVSLSGSAKILKDIYALLSVNPDIYLSEEPEESNYYLALNNGLLDVRSLQLQPLTPDVFVIAHISGNFLPNQVPACPVFDQFLQSITGGDQVLVERLWEMIGYILTPDTKGKCFFILQGVPDSGKTLLGDLIASFFNDQDVTSLSMDDLNQHFGPAELVGKHLCMCMDLSSGLWDARATGVLKTLTGGDLLTVDFKYKSRVKLRNKAKILFATNHAVGTKEDDSALLRRVVCIPFRYSVPREAQDQELLAKLKQERDAILTRALIAYGTLRSKKYIFSGDGVYHLNDVVNGGRFGGVAPALSLDEAVLDFAHRHCRSVATEEAFMADLFGAFQKENPAMTNIQVQTFSAKLHKVLDAMFPSQLEFKSKRREAGTNPISCVIGLQLIL